MNGTANKAPKSKPAKVADSQTEAQIAELFGVDQSTIRRYVTEGCPHTPGKRGKGRLFHEGRVAEWMAANRKTGNIGRPKEKDSRDLDAVKLEKEKAILAKYVRENAVADGKLIDAETEERRDIAKIVAVRNRLCGMGAALAPSLAGLDCPAVQSLIDEHVESILKELACYAVTPEQYSAIDSAIKAVLAKPSV